MMMFPMNDDDLEDLVAAGLATAPSWQLLRAALAHQPIHVVTGKPDKMSCAKVATMAIASKGAVRKAMPPTPAYPPSFHVGGLLTAQRTPRRETRSFSAGRALYCMYCKAGAMVEPLLQPRRSVSMCVWRVKTVAFGLL